MAELRLKVGSSLDAKNYQDGDIICAFNDRMISQCWLENDVCHIRNAASDSNNYKSVSSLAYKWLETTKEFKFEQLSATEVRRTNLLTLDTEVISNRANSAGEYMHVQLYIERRMKQLNHGIFGARGAAVWFGGKTVATTANLNSVWDYVELNSAIVRTDYTKAPAGRLDLQHMFNLTVDYFSDENSKRYIDSDSTRKRLRRVNYRALVSAETLALIDNPAISVDTRDNSPFSVSIIETKS